MNSPRVMRVPIDDDPKALYTHIEDGERNFYGGHHLKAHTLALEKNIYNFSPRSTKVIGVLVLQDKYGQKWKLLDHKELETHQHLGVLVSPYFKEDMDTIGLGTSKGSPHVGFTID